MNEDASKKNDVLSENKNQTQEVTKGRESIWKWFNIFLWSAFIPWAILRFFMGIFPYSMPISTANELLGTLISVDGILLGFMGIIFAQLLSSLMDQQNVLYQRILEEPKEDLLCVGALDFVKDRRNVLFGCTLFTFTSLLGSIFVSMATIANNSNLPSTVTLPTGISSTIMYPTYNFLFGPLWYTFIAVMLLALALPLLPMGPPLSPIQKDNQPKT